MQKNVTFPIGTVALIDKIDSETGFFKKIRKLKLFYLVHTQEVKQQLIQIGIF